MWIELSGPPGVGKSTTYDFISSAVNHKKRSEEPPKQWHSWIAWTEAEFKKCSSNRAVSRLSSYRRKVRYAAAAKYRQVFDDLITQRGQSLAASGAPLNVVRRYFEMMPAPGGVVLLKNELSVIQGRNKSRTDDINIRRKRRVDLSAEADTALVVLEIAAEVLVERGIPIIRLTTDCHPHENARRIDKWISCLP